MIWIYDKHEFPSTKKKCLRIWYEEMQYKSIEIPLEILTQMKMHWTASILVFENTNVKSLESSSRTLPTRTIEYILLTISIGNLFPYQPHWDANVRQRKSSKCIISCLTWMWICINRSRNKCLLFFELNKMLKNNSDYEKMIDAKNYDNNSEKHEISNEVLGVHRSADNQFH